MKRSYHLSLQTKHILVGKLIGIAAQVATKCVSKKMNC